MKIGVSDQYLALSRKRYHGHSYNGRRIGLVCDQSNDFEEPIFQCHDI